MIKPPKIESVRCWHVRSKVGNWSLFGPDKPPRKWLKFWHAVAIPGLFVPDPPKRKAAKAPKTYRYEADQFATDEIEAVYGEFGPEDEAVARAPRKRTKHGK